MYVCMYIYMHTYYVIRSLLDRTLVHRRHLPNNVDTHLKLSILRQIWVNEFAYRLVNLRFDPKTIATKRFLMELTVILSVSSNILKVYQNWQIGRPHVKWLHQYTVRNYVMYIHLLN